MTDQHPFTPLPELVKQWKSDFYGRPTTPGKASLHIAARAAQWGADQELKACCAWLDGFNGDGEMLRLDRRPKLPSLKEQALDAMREMQIEPCVINGVDTNAAIRAKYDIIRRALEALPDD